MSRIRGSKLSESTKEKMSKKRQEYWDNLKEVGEVVLPGQIDHKEKLKSIDDYIVKIESENGDLQEIAAARLDSMIRLGSQIVDLQRKLDEQEINLRGAVKAYVVDKDLKEAEARAAIQKAKDAPHGLSFEMLIDRESLLKDLQPIIDIFNRLDFKKYIIR